MCWKATLSIIKDLDFKTYPGLFYEGTPEPKYFMALPFYDDVPEGKVEFHQAFYGNMK